MHSPRFKKAEFRPTTRTYYIKILVSANILKFFCLYFIYFYYFCATFTLLKAPNGLRWAKCIYIKGVTERFGFDGLRISQIQNNLSKTKQRGRPMRCLLTHTNLHMWVCRVVVYNISVGLSALLVSTDWAMREPLDRGTSIRRAPRLFMFMQYNN